MKSKTSQILFTYWNEVRKDRLAPRRFEIEPSRIAPILSETFILERLEGDMFRFRIAGTGITEQFGTDFRGTNFLDGWAPDDRVTLSRHLRSLSQQGGVGVSSFDVRTRRSIERYETILLPLIHTGNEIDRLLGGMSQLSGGVQRVRHDHMAERQLLTCDVIWPDGRPHSVISNLRQQTPILPHVRNARIVRADRRQFRVYEGGLGRTEATET